MIKDVAGERSTTRAILNHAYFEGLDRSDVLNLRLERKFLFQFVFVRDELTQHIQHPTNQHPVSIRSPFRYRLVMVSMFSFCFNSVSRRREGPGGHNNAAGVSAGPSISSFDFWYMVLDCHNGVSCTE